MKKVENMIYIKDNRDRGGYMMNYFERIRRSIFNEKIRKYKLYSIIFGILSIIGGVLTLCVHISFILIDVILLGIMFYMIQGLIKYNHLLESSQGDIFYQRISEYGYYYDVIRDISYSMENECLYQKSHVYITKDWIVDFDAKDIGVIQLDQIIWMYGVQLNGMAYVKCHLDNMNEFFISIGPIDKIIRLISEQRPKILIGYSHKLETLMKEDPQLFVDNLKKEIYPTDKGTWK